MGHNVPRVSIGTVSNIMFFLTGLVTRAYVTVEVLTKATLSVGSIHVTNQGDKKKRKGKYKKLVRYSLTSENHMILECVRTYYMTGSSKLDYK